MLQLYVNFGEHLLCVAEINNLRATNINMPTITSLGMNPIPFSFLNSEN